MVVRKCRVVGRRLAADDASFGRCCGFAAAVCLLRFHETLLMDDYQVELRDKVGTIDEILFVLVQMG